jgi:surface antigen
MPLRDDLAPRMVNAGIVPKTNQRVARTEQLPIVDTHSLRAEPPDSVADLSSLHLRAVQRAYLTQGLAPTVLQETTTSLRVPIVIKGTRKNGVPVSRDLPKKHRMILSLLATLLLLFITGGTLLAASPLGRDIGLNRDPIQTQGKSSLIQNEASNLANLAPQATATAVSHQKADGYDPYAKGKVTVAKSRSTGSSGSSAVASVDRSLNWPVGQCTSWANSRYHQLTGYWIPWSGNADQWVEGARMAHWNVSTSPHIPSVIVLMPGVEGASSAYGHVAVAEKRLNSTTVESTTMNWYANGGGFNIESTWNFTTASGVYFVWHP